MLCWTDGSWSLAVQPAAVTETEDLDYGKGQMSMESDNDDGWVRVTRGGGVHLGHVTRWGMMMMMVMVVVAVEKGRSRFALTPAEGWAEVEG
jgi:hypothetical protein